MYVYIEKTRVITIKYCHLKKNIFYLENKKIDAHLFITNLHTMCGATLGMDDTQKVSIIVSVNIFKNIDTL